MPEKENPAAATPENWRRDKTAKPTDGHSVRFLLTFFVGRAQNAAGCMPSPLGALKCVPSFLKEFDRFDKPEFITLK
ncbi:MAG: hypothetical protein ACLUI3_01625 [Christensenellales bacterium]